MRIFLFLFLFWPVASLAEDDGGAFLDVPANPLRIDVVGDPDHSVTKRIGPDGGEIKAKAPDGARLILTVPKGALLTETSITLTPIAQVSGLPGDISGLTGAMMEPDGLQFFVPATLEIQPLQPMGLGDRLHWGFSEHGEETLLHMPDLKAEGIVIPLDHFSGAGVSLAAKVDLQLDRWRQSALQDRIETELAKLTQEKAADGTVGKALTTALIEDAARVLNHGLKRIAFSDASTCADLLNAVAQLNAIEKQRQVLGIADDTGDAELAGRLRARHWEVCFPEAKAQCLATGDLRILIDFMLAAEKERQLAGVESGSEYFDPGHEAELRAAMEQCGRYKLTVQAMGHWVDGVGVYGDVGFKVEVPIRLKFAGSDVFSFSLFGEAPATDVNITFVDYACWVLETYRQGAPMQAKLTDLIFDKDHAPKRVTLAMKGPELFAVTSCTSKKRGKKTIESPVSESTWGIAHAGNRSGPGYILKTMKAGSHPKLFSYSWEGTGTAANVTSNDTTILTLEHIGG